MRRGKESFLFELPSAGTGFFSPLGLSERGGGGEDGCNPRLKCKYGKTEWVSECVYNERTSAGKREVEGYEIKKEGREEEILVIAYACKNYWQEKLPPSVFFLRTRAAHFKWGIKSRLGFFFFLKQNCAGNCDKELAKQKGHPQTSSETVEYVHKRSIKGNYFDLPNPPSLRIAIKRGSWIENQGVVIVWFASHICEKRRRGGQRSRPGGG